jgi:hypothetical protein
VVDPGLQIYEITHYIPQLEGLFWYPL